MTVIINTQEELEALIDKNNNIIIDGDLVINCNIDIEANIEAECIEAISDINAWDIKAFYIKARDIKANDIDIDHINAHNIRYYSFCIAKKSLVCETIEGERKNALHACLDQPIEYI